MSISVTLKPKSKKHKPKKLLPQSFDLDVQENLTSFRAKQELNQIGQIPSTQTHNKIDFFQKNQSNFNPWIDHLQIPINSQLFKHPRPKTSFQYTQSSELHSLDFIDIELSKNNSKRKAINKFTNQNKKENLFQQKIIKLKFQTQNTHKSQIDKKVLKRKFWKTSRGQFSSKNCFRSNYTSISQDQAKLSISKINIDGQILLNSQSKSLKRQNQLQKKEIIRNRIKSGQRFNSLSISHTKQPQKVNKHIIYTQSPLYLQFKKIKQYLKRQGLKHESQHHSYKKSK